MFDQTKHVLVCDIECYRDYFLIGFKSTRSGKFRYYEMHADQPLDTVAVRALLTNYRIVTFNGNNYDVPMLMLALRGATCAELKAASDWIIVGENRGWQFYDHFNLRAPEWLDHIDLIEVAFGQGSLKLYGGRLHSRKLQDLPIEPGASISPEQRVLMVSYNENDLQTTIDLFTHLKPQIELRERMSLDYGIDLRSKSDAQIAEAVLRKQLTIALGDKPQKPNIPAGTTFRYRPPAFLKFKTEALQRKLIEVAEASFVIDTNGAPIEPPALAGQVIRLGAGEYRLGIGGLHSSEARAAHYADENTVLLDRDVASYYPAIVLLCGLYPKHLTDAFLRVYKSIVDRRLLAKRKGEKVVADALKITINGSFGKLGSKYSILYAPDLMIQVTVTGQLALLMFIESVELAGIPVVSANTDGIVIKCPASRMDELNALVTEWEKATGFETEETRYKALYSRDVNNYFALKAAGGHKGKGAFAPISISKNPQNTICVEAVAAWLEHDIPLAETIMRCRDIRKFVTVRTVRGGAIKITRTTYDDSLTPGKKRDLLLDYGWQITEAGPIAKLRLTRPGTLDTMGEEPMDVETAYRTHCGADEFDYIGKVVRFYYAYGEDGALHYKTPNKSGGRNKVPSSDGARPLMELPDEFPCDVDYGRYIEEANSILKDIGARP